MRVFFPEVISYMGGEAVAAVVLSSFSLCVAIIAVLLRSKLAWRIATDVPNARSLHSRPIPRIGGWGIVPAAVVAALVFASEVYLAVLIGLLFLLSYFDDRVSLPIYVRLPAHVSVAAAWLYLGPVSLPLYIAAMAAFAIVWVTNFFNFMDGSDGLAGGMALVGFSIFGAVAATAGITPLAIWSLALASASAGFLLFNFPPARIFLGDAGSVTIGFLAGAFGIWGWAAGAWPVWFPFLVSAPFFLDATVTILKRMVRGEKFWRAHREHYYQRLIRSGWSHRRTAIAEYALMIASSALAVTMLTWSPGAQYAGLAAALGVYAAIALVIEKRWAASQGNAQPDAIRTAAAVLSGDSRLAEPQQGKRGRHPFEVNSGKLTGQTARAAVRSRRSDAHESGAEIALDDRALAPNSDNGRPAYVTKNTRGAGTIDAGERNT